MFETHIPVIHGILDHLFLEDILKFRLVCSSFKHIVDDYLSNQESLLIFIGEMHATYLHKISSMSSNYKFCNRLIIFRKKLNKDQEVEFQNNVLKLFPHIRQFFLFENFLPFDSDINLKPLAQGLISQWKQINKLILCFSTRDRSSTYFEASFFKCLNDLESLETLVIYDSRLTNLFDYSIIASFNNQPFLNRVKNLFLPVIDWLQNFKGSSNITSLGFQTVPEEEIPEFLFEKLENIYYSDTYLEEGLLEFLYNLSLVNSTNLSSFGFDYDSVSVFIIVIIVAFVFIIIFI